MYRIVRHAVLWGLVLVRVGLLGWLLLHRLMTIDEPTFLNLKVPTSVSCGWPLGLGYELGYCVAVGVLDVL